MNATDNYKYLLFKGLYNYLNLNEIENKISNNIKPLNVVSNEDYDIISKYFFLKNNVNVDKLNKEENEFFNYYFKKDIKECSDSELRAMNDFIKNTYKRTIFPDVSDDYVYYGPINDEYLCPKDSIVIGIYYDLSNENDFEIENQVSDIANYIQFEVANNKKLKIAVVAFNQFSLDNTKNFSK